MNVRPIALSFTILMASCSTSPLPSQGQSTQQSGTVATIQTQHAQQSASVPSGIPPAPPVSIRDVREVPPIMATADPDGRSDEFCFEFLVPDKRPLAPATWSGSYCFRRGKACKEGRSEAISDISKLLGDDMGRIESYVSDCKPRRLVPYCYEYVTIDRDQLWQQCSITFPQCAESWRYTSFAPFSSCGEGRNHWPRTQKVKGPHCASIPRGNAGAVCGLSAAHCWKLLETEKYLGGSDPGRCIEALKTPWCSKARERRYNEIVLVCADSLPACGWRVNNEYEAPRKPCSLERGGRFGE